MPPLPIIYGGEVYVNDVLLMGDTELTVRVGDWESRSVPVRNGKFLALIAGPPNLTYVDQPITFHLNGMEAVQRFVFPLQGAPSSERIRLEFDSIAEPTAPPMTVPEPTATPGPTPTRTQGQATAQPTKSPEADAGTEADNAEDKLSIPWAMLGGLLGGATVLLIGLNLIFRRALRVQD